MEKEYPKYRIDVFSGGHKSIYFDTKEEAEMYGEKQTEKGKIAFLLEHIIDSKYDVIKEVK